MTPPPQGRRTQPTRCRRRHLKGTPFTSKVIFVTAGSGAVEFYGGDRPPRAEESTDPRRRGMLPTARAVSSAERAWLHEVLDGEAEPRAEED